MAWRGLHLTQPARLALADGQILIGRDDGEVRLPLEDIAYMVIDTPQASLSLPLLTACMDAGLAVIITDPKHLPSGVMLPFHRHFRQGGMARLQVDQTEPFRKRLWQAVVRAKIENQGAVLKVLGREDAGPLAAMVRLVGSGDPENVEARAARAYWSRLWQNFRREDESDLRNALLNYGYAVLRACVARALVGIGFLPAFGIHHASVTNAFNLADDMLEPFRPFIDLLAWRRLGGADAARTMSLEDRQAMAGAMMENAAMGEDEVTLLVAAERMAASLARAMEERRPEALLLPRLVT
ncbi:MAG: type II CRISPR-associated endonuclease Cas1 [Acetobacteraceae bacterium]|jgi:CRISPR-associated protein Cas1|nr:type II CRISPR-associated endonuclease Cas1 [Acetobacteraceae bacterium]